MREFKGTKQEWLIDGKTVYAVHKSKFGGGFVDANRFYCTMYPDYHSKNAVNEVEHNMKLVMAAPELLKACLDMTKYCNENNIIELVPEYEQMCNAINKALGDEEV